jgi:hypothetical protein
MKIALCFIISYDHILNKEHIWREWIEPNKDIINVYFYYKDLRKIKSKWIMEHTLPPNYIYETSYYHVIPAYVSIMQFAMNHDTQNKWFCMLTDSCCPIISPKKFRYLFYKEYNHSLFSWKPAWWNPYYHQRGNLAKLPKELWLANDPWFVLTRANVNQILHFIVNQKTITETICGGGLANETLFAVIFKFYKELEDNSKIPSHINCVVSHIADWNRRSSTTSPHVFKDANEADINFIDKEIERNNYACFIRKIATEFPDEILRYYIYEKNKEKETQLILVEPTEMIINRYKYIINGLFFLTVVYVFYLLYVFII